ncbi:hypothetical protein RO3G_01160 [Rhizopus delemar RA 99-880]|uniref:Uncharacterized protein n=1 Tax=Rhizopus delemar (strain RA 99-880 / ATCC MYA-4621 / FGSC 9543 / NRRL 43880) TaxID=246409 RepID=I1BJR5_RHIO9|nr:hypothetical protein RO3G_01149 [Rhizopus delemar RA 99-880]EIE76456.1 hypothetical protein RO3G_01160 [Rhizopus delemar RA 99-880]|eukprot:EIE76445.1 hypothetical protein RO3G_01149 [Rhizopus delemar RA 99-880]
MAMKEYVQGVRYDQVVKMHLNITAGALLIIQRVYLNQPLGLCRANKQEESNTI